MDGHKLTREGDGSLCLRAFPKYNLILTHYMISAWWLHPLDRLVQYVIILGAIEQVLLTTNNIMTIGYTYTKLRLKKPHYIF